jgi:hypothetical protein
MALYKAYDEKGLKYLLAYSDSYVTPRGHSRSYKVVCLTQTSDIVPPIDVDSSVE